MPMLPSLDRLWASHFPFRTSVSSSVKWGRGTHLFILEVLRRACDVPGTVQGAQGPPGIYILVEETDPQQADK